MQVKKFLTIESNAPKGQIDRSKLISELGISVSSYPPSMYLMFINFKTSFIRTMY